MARVLAKVAAVMLALGALGGAAQAGSIEIRITTTDRHYGPPPTPLYGANDDDDDYRRPHVVTPRHRYGLDDYDDDRRYFAPPRGYGHAQPAPGRYYGRPVPERSYWDRHSYGHPVALRGWRERHEDCRIVVKRKVNDWGEVVLKHKRICD